MNDSERNNCRHHWRIATPNGPTCEAVCLLCGARREFNSATENQWLDSD